MAKTWPAHSPSNWSFLNLDHFARGCSMPNLILLGVSCSPLSLKWPKYGPFVAKTWSLHGPSNWLFLNFNYWTKGYSMPNFIFLGLPISPFLKNGKNMALYGQNMVLIWSLKLVLPESLSICQGMFHAKFHIAGCSF